MNAADAYTAATAEMAKNGLLASGWELRMVPSTDFAGNTLQNSKIVLLSTTFVARRNRAQVLDVIRHEIAHAIVGMGHGHDAVWVAAAQGIGCSGVQKVA